MDWSRSVNSFGDSELRIEGDSDSDPGLDVEIEERTYSSAIHKIFSARFDPMEGPIIEWEYQLDDKKPIVIDGTEFTVMASGLHNETGPDFVYFKCNNYYGVGCFVRHLKGNVEGRDALMRSIGIITEHYGFLPKHCKFLEMLNTQMTKAALNNTFKESFISYFDQYQEFNMDTKYISNPNLSSNLPQGAMDELFTQLSSSLFTLWKLILLGKKVLFVSEPPIHTMCMNVYASSYLLYNHVKNFKGILGACNLLFYVNITQTRMLLEQRSYIACTTEKIFESKSHLYDAIVFNTGPNEERIHVVDKDLEKVVKLTNGDRLRFMSLMTKYQAQDQGTIISFFQDLNNTFLQGIASFQSIHEPVSVGDVRKLGMHESDFDFVVAMADHLNIDVEYQQKSWCCM